jgi:general transcription factor 3C polypeptide 5 (transcription factor C subunit 1)
MPPKYQKYMKLLLPQVAYMVMWGPWRGTWVRYGYDPRKDKNARLFQAILLRFVKKPDTFKRAKRFHKVDTSDDLIMRGTKSKEALPDGSNGDDSWK